MTLKTYGKLSLFIFLTLYQQLGSKGAKFCVLWSISTDHLNQVISQQSSTGVTKYSKCIGITCRAWHHDASNSSDGPPVVSSKLFLQIENYPCVALTCPSLWIPSARTVGNCVSFFVARFCGSGIKYPASRASFPSCFLPRTSRLRRSYSRRLACLRRLVLQLWIKTSDLENSIWATRK